MALNEQLINKVHELVIQAGMGKFLEPLWRDADGPLLQADRICRDYPGAVPPIYPALIHYRLALLALRDIKSLTQTQLIDVSERLNKASSFKQFGPWPLLYRMVVLKKLKDKEELKRVFRDAIEFVSDQSGLVRGIQEADSTDLHYPGMAQSHIFNAMELATFFCELDYGPLTGVLDSFMGHSNGYAPGLSAEALDWVMICFRDGMKVHRNLEQPFIESAANTYFDEACAQGDKALLVSLDLDAKINQKRCRCSDPQHLRKWTRDVKTAPLRKVLKSNPRDSTDRDHCTRLRHLFGDAISFSDSGVSLHGAATLIVTMKGDLWLAGWEDCDP
jgi:hypothetical protein